MKRQICRICFADITHDLIFVLMKDDEMLEKETLECAHCGLDCPDDSIKYDDKNFCCTGCKTVYELLHDNELDAFYKMDMDPSKRKKADEVGNKYEFLESQDLQEKLLAFKIGKNSKIILKLPDIHCSACIYLLENLPRLNPNIIESTVNFVKKEASVVFDNTKMSLKEVSELLDSIGYPPNFDLSDTKGQKKNSFNRKLYFKLGAAGFAFGNIMLFSFPEYLSGSSLDSETKIFLTWISLILSPLVLYAGWDYFVSAWSGLRVKHVNIDVPISIGIITLELRSAYEIISGTGFGFIDSLSGLIFFLLLGKVFQKKTYDRLSFDRDYSSYFPLSVLKKGEPDKYIPLTELKVGDRILIRNGEIIPSDGLLFTEKALIDYSFVTGESIPVEIQKGEKIFAGGRLVGSLIEVDTVKDFDKSYLTELWNNKAFEKDQDENSSVISDTVAKYFTFAILTIALGTLAYWYLNDPSIMLNAFTSVLIIACPCALALTIPFTYGTALRILGKNGLFLKNDKLIESLAGITSIVFDKTGTLTNSGNSKLIYKGKELNSDQEILIKSVVRHSTHPLSKSLDDFIKRGHFDVESINEIAGKGIESKVSGHNIRLGSGEWLGEKSEKQETSVHIEIDGNYFGYYALDHDYRIGIWELLKSLKKYLKISIVSGDNDKEKEFIEGQISGLDLNFNKLPEDKLQYIQKLSSSENVMMVGDGLNDAGALKQAKVGIAIAENSSSFTPGSDGILLGSEITKLSNFLSFSKSSLSTVYQSFTISFLYNIIGLYFAVTGQLSPVYAAILMPLSSITVVLFTVLSTNWKGRRI